MPGSIAVRDMTVYPTRCVCHTLYMTHTEHGSTPVVEIEHLTKTYGNHTVLNDLNLSIAPGAVTALLGPNGAGKTTLVNILTTLVPFDQGRVRVLGHDVRTERRAVQQLISVTGQFAAVDEVLTGRENLVMMAQLLGMSTTAARARSDELLSRFELANAAGKRAATYSGGMRRKLDLAVSLLASPQVLFLDEPTTGLDTRSRQALWEDIRELSAAGTSVFLTTQYLEEADALANRILVLSGGSIVADGTAAQLKAATGRGAIVEVHDEHGQVVREIDSDGTAEDLASITASLADTSPTADISVRRPTLDEAFLALTAPAGTGEHPHRINDATNSTDTTQRIAR